MSITYSQEPTQSCTTRQGLAEQEAAIHRLIVQDYAARLYLSFCTDEHPVPFKQDGTTYAIISGDLADRKVVAKLPDGRHELLSISEQDVSYLHQYCYQHLYQTYAQDERAHHSEPTPQDELTTENQQLRERITDLEAQHEQQYQRYHDLERRHTEQYERFFGLFDWMRKLFANPTIPAACKLVLWHFYTVFFFMRASVVGEEMRIGVEDTANALGISTSTVRKATDKAEMWDVLARRYEPYEMADGEKRTLVHITLAEAVAHPEEVHMEKLHGGKRVKKCHKCGSEDVDRYTVQYCRQCDINAWYGQPGLRSDADVLRAQRAPNTPLYKSGQKQDAFENTEHEPDPPTIADRVDHDIPTDRRDCSQKQDAFEQIAPNHPEQEAHLALRRELLEIGQHTGYRRFILGSTNPEHAIFINPGKEAWTIYSARLDSSHLPAVVAAAQRYYRYQKQEHSEQIASEDQPHISTAKSTRPAEEIPTPTPDPLAPTYRKIGTCKAQFLYNKHGEKAGGLDPLSSCTFRDCGSPFWYPSPEHEYICAECREPIATTRREEARRQKSE